MTLQETQSLTNEEIRVRVAELCGWKYTGPDDMRDVAFACWYPPGCDHWQTGEPPNYPADLNACASFEATFISDYERAVKYSWNLLRAIRLEVPEDADDLNLDYCWHIAHAPARARCEAFLAVMQPDTP